MSNEDATRAAEAAIAVMAALQPLSAEERSRVLLSAAALFGVSISPQVAGAPAQGAPAQGGAGAATHNLGAGSGKRLSIVELLQDRGAATNSQRIACFAYYREHIEGEANFASLDLAAYFPKAKLPAPGSNYSRDYNAAVKEGWIHDEGAKSYLTQKGEKAIEAGFGGKAKPRGASSGKKRKAAKPE